MKKKKEQDSLDEKIKKEWKYLRHIKIKDENHLLFASFIILMAALLIVNTAFVINRANGSFFNNSPKKGVSNLNKILTSQQAAVSDKFHINISKVYESDAHDPAFTLLPTDTLLVMDISITNKSSGDQDFVPVNQIYVRDRDGGYYAMHTSLSLKSPIEAKTLNGGQTVSGQISFSVPKRLAHPLLYVDLGWDDSVPVVFDVMK